MAGKPKPMSQIKQLLRLHKQGKGQKFIASALGISRNTVKSYLQKVKYAKLDIDELLALEDPELEKKFFAGSPAYKEPRYDALKGELSYYVSELKRIGVTKQLLWEEYKDKYPNGYSRSQFYFHLKQYQKASKPTMVLEHKAGEKLYVDFAGKKMHYTDPSTGEIKACEMFVASMPYSDYSFAMAVKSQTTEDLLYALSCCLEDFGGVPEIVVTDNLKASVIKADKYEPELNRVMEDFANHYGFTLLPARVYKPQDKALVENLVNIVYSRVYARLRNDQFFSIDELNNAIKEKVALHNQTRMQNKPWSREEKFIADEKHLLKPLPKERFEIKFYTQLKVQHNNHIYLGRDKHYYSVPYEHIGKTAKVIYTRSMVHIYIDGSQVAVHKRNYRQGAYTTEEKHLCSAHRHYKNRSPEYYIKKAYGRSQMFGKYIEGLFKTKRHPEQLYKSCDGLLKIERNENNKARFDKACEIALSNGIFGYKRLINILKNDANFIDDETSEIQVEDRQNGGSKNEDFDKDITSSYSPLPSHGNIRGSSYYNKIVQGVKQLSLKLFTL